MCRRGVDADDRDAAAPFVAGACDGGIDGAGVLAAVVDKNAGMPMSATSSAAATGHSRLSRRSSDCVTQNRHHGHGVTVAAGAAVDPVEGDEEEDETGVPDTAGPDGVAPFITPSLAGTRYVVAEIVAVICGNPAAPGRG